MAAEATSAWDVEPLGEHATVKARLGWKGLKAEEYVDDGFVFLSAPNVKGVRIDFDHVNFVSEWRYRESPEIQLQPGDVLLVKDGSTLGMVGFVRALPAPATVNGSIAVIRPKKGLRGEFLYYLVRGEDFQRQIRLSRSGLGVPHLFQADLRRFLVPIPPDQVQVRIAEILSTVDEAIEQTEALIAKTQQIKAGLMHDLFTRGVTPDGQLRPPRQEAPELYKESELGWIPREWEVGGLASRRAPGRPHVKTGPFGSSLKLEHWVEEGVPVVTIGALGEGEFIEPELLHVAESTAQRLADYRLEIDDIVFSRVADVGRSAVIRSAQSGWLMSSNLMRIALDGTRVVASFLQAQLSDDSRIKSQIHSKVNNGGRDVANSAILNQLRFSWPPLAEQERIVGRFESLESFSGLHVADLGKLHLLKSGLTSRLLSARIRQAVLEEDAEG